MTYQRISLAAAQRRYDEIEDSSMVEDYAADDVFRPLTPPEQLARDLDADSLEVDGNVYAPAELAAIKGSAPRADLVGLEEIVHTILDLDTRRPRC